MTDPDDGPSPAPAPPAPPAPPSPPEPPRSPFSAPPVAGGGTGGTEKRKGKRNGNGKGKGNGDGIVKASWIGTTALGVTTALATAVKAVQPIALATSLALFLAGTVAFFIAFVKAVDRSRTEEIGVMNLFFLDHSAPKPVKRNLLASLTVQAAVATTAAAIRPNTAVAFAVLAPIYGLSLAGLWAARHGTFPPRRTTANNEPKDSKK